VGDCMSSDTPLFFGALAGANYDLGEYESLREVIDFYNQNGEQQRNKTTVTPFNAPSFAAQTGYNVASINDPLWLPETRLCPADSSPLACEYHITQPALAIIMSGTNDVLSLTAEQYDFYMRLTVYQTIDRGVVPLLSTFPGYMAVAERAAHFNQIVYAVGRDYNVPVMNLWLALQGLPNHGLDADTAYLTYDSFAGVAHFDEKNLQYGYTVRNLVTLQALNIFWRQVIQGAQ
jgi:hypothetical protein